MKIKCCVCHKHKKGQTTKITEKQIEYFQSQGNYVLESGIICNQCRQVFFMVMEKSKKRRKMISINHHPQVQLLHVLHFQSLLLVKLREFVPYAEQLKVRL